MELELTRASFLAVLFPNFGGIHTPMLSVSNLFLVGWCLNAIYFIGGPMFSYKSLPQTKAS